MFFLPNSININLAGYVMKKLNPDLKRQPKTSSSKELEVTEDIENAALIGGNAMASNEPFGPVIGAAMGAVEEGMALLKEKKDKHKR